MLVLETAKGRLRSGLYVPLAQTPEVGSRGIVASLALSQDQEDGDVDTGDDCDRGEGRDHACILLSASSP